MHLTGILRNNFTQMPQKADFLFGNIKVWLKKKKKMKNS